MYTQNWFEQLAQKNFETLKNIIKVNDKINFLEIGCFEGNCHKWIYENILVNPESKSTVIDPFEQSNTHPNAYNTFVNNLENYLNRITIKKGFSDNVLPSLEKESFDIIYIDGDHSTAGVFKDAVNSIPLLKKGGIMIFDDYLWGGIDGFYRGGSLSIGNTGHPLLGINLFLFAYKEQFEIMSGFNPPCAILDLDKLRCDENYRNELSNKYNYQIFIKKL